MAGRTTRVPAIWRGWISWEYVLAGGAALPSSAENGAGLAEDAVDLARVAAVPRPQRLGRLRALVDDTSRRRPPWQAADLSVLHALSDPEADTSNASVQRWREGKADVASRGFPAFGADIGDSGPLAVVVARPAGRGCRVLGWAHGGRLYETNRVGRVEATIAVLAIQTAADVASVFRSVYGFAYDPSLHRGAFDATLHRAQAVLADVAFIERNSGDLSLEVRSPFAVSDPRCVRSLEAELLRCLARAGEISARSAAQQAGLGLRSVHYALRQLVDDGILDAEKRGRHVLYRVQDTTFVQPTNRHWVTPADFSRAGSDRGKTLEGRDTPFEHESTWCSSRRAFPDG